MKIDQTRARQHVFDLHAWRMPAELMQDAEFEIAIGRQRRLTRFGGEDHRARRMRNSQRSAKAGARSDD
jgi:hypothetical protein